MKLYHFSYCKILNCEAVTIIVYKIPVSYIAKEILFSGRAKSCTFKGDDNTEGLVKRDPYLG